MDHFGIEPSRTSPKLVPINLCRLRIWSSDALTRALHSVLYLLSLFLPLFSCQCPARWTSTSSCRWARSARSTTRDRWVGCTLKESRVVFPLPLKKRKGFKFQNCSNARDAEKESPSPFDVFEIDGDGERKPLFFSLLEPPSSLASRRHVRNFVYRGGGGGGGGGRERGGIQCCYWQRSVSPLPLPPPLPLSSSSPCYTINLKEGLFLPPGASSIFPSLRILHPLPIPLLLLLLLLLLLKICPTWSRMKGAFISTVIQFWPGIFSQLPSHLLLLAANQSPPDVQAALAGAPDDPELVCRLVAGGDQRARRHGRPLLDAGHHHTRPGERKRTTLTEKKTLFHVKWKQLTWKKINAQLCTKKDTF